MKHKFSFVIVYWWLLLLLTGGLLLLLFAPKQERISESENRMLSGFPEFSAQSLASGEFFLGIESYLSDGFWGRDQIVGISNGILNLFCANTADEANMLKDAAMADELQGVTPGQNQEAASEEAAELPPEEVLPQPSQEDASSSEFVGFGMWRVAHNGSRERVLEVKDSDLRQVASVLNGYRKCLPEDGHVFYTNVPLTSRALFTRDGFASWYDNTSKGLSQYTEPGIHPINTPEILEEALWAGQPVYFTADHHWTPLAAMMVANECIKTLGFPTLSYEEYDYTIKKFSNSTENTADDLALMHPLQPVSGMLLSRSHMGEPRALINYDSTTYRAYLNGDSQVWSRYDTGFATGRQALVIGDSFSNAFTPYLLPYYDSVYKVDARYYSPGENGGTMAELMEKYGIDDVYIVLSQANGVASHTSQTKLEDALNG